MLLEVTLHEAHRVLLRLAQDQLSLEHSRRLPLRSDFQSPPGLGPGALAQTGASGSDGQRVVRLGVGGIRQADLLDQPEDRHAVILTGERAVQAEQVVAQRSGIGLEQAHEIRRRRVELAGEQHDTDQHLQGTLRFRLDLEPHPCRFGRQIVAPGKAAHLDRPLEHLDVARAQRQIGVGAACQLDLAAAQGDFAEQDLKDGPCQQVFRRFGLRRRRLRSLDFALGHGTLLGGSRCRTGGRIGSGGRQADGQSQGAGDEETGEKLHGLPVDPDLDQALSRLRHNGLCML